MKTLLATDGSAHSLLAEELVTKLPVLSQSPVIVASVSSPPIQMMAPLAQMGDIAYAQQLSQVWERSREMSVTFARESAERLTAKGVSANSTALEGNIADSLLECATKESCSIIAVGSRGEGAFKSFFLGSVTRKLANDAPQSILIARHDQDKTAEETLSRIGEISRLKIVVCCDGSEGADAAMAFVGQNGQKAFDESFVICAEPLDGLPMGLPPSIYESTIRYEHDRAKEIVSEAAHQISEYADRTVAETQVGRTADVIISTAERHKADLIILGASRHGRIERALLGSVAYEVATNAPCSVLIVRTQ